MPYMFYSFHLFTFLLGLLLVMPYRLLGLWLLDLPGLTSYI